MEQLFYGEEMEVEREEIVEEREENEKEDASSVFPTASSSLPMETEITQTVSSKYFLLFVFQDPPITSSSSSSPPPPPPQEKTSAISSISDVSSPPAAQSTTDDPSSRKMSYEEVCILWYFNEKFRRKWMKRQLRHPEVQFGFLLLPVAVHQLLQRIVKKRTKPLKRRIQKSSL